MTKYTWEPMEKFDDADIVDGRPFIYSKGERVLISTACETQCTFFNESNLHKYHAKLLASNVTLEPYWQIGKQMGNIYRLETFPIDNSEIVYHDLIVFNIEKLYNNKLNVSAIFSDQIFDFFSHHFDDLGNRFYTIGVNDSIATMKRVNAYLDEIVSQKPTF